MLRILGSRAPACDGTSRREVLRSRRAVAFRLDDASSPAARGGGDGGKADAQAQVDHPREPVWRPQPPRHVRHEAETLRPRSGASSGRSPPASRALHICEHMPRLARWMHKATLIRSVTHGYNSHNPYAVLTGFTGGDDRENYFTKRSDHPGISAVCQYLGIGPRDLPGSVFLPALPGYSQGLRRAGPYGGYLGRQYDPLFADCDPRFPREFNQDQSFYDPVTPFGEPRLPSFASEPG